MRRLAIVLLLTTIACGSKGASSAAEPWAIGTYLGGGSVLTGPSGCTYAAAPSVAEIDAAHPTIAKVVGPGVITETCGDTTRTYEALQATRLEIRGPATSPIGKESADTYTVVPFAGARELGGVHQGGPAPDWQLGPDCAGVAAFAPVLGAQDTGGADITRRLVGAKAGACTLTASILGLRGTKSVQIQ